MRLTAAAPPQLCESVMQEARSVARAEVVAMDDGTGSVGATTTTEARAAADMPTRLTAAVAMYCLERLVEQHADPRVATGIVHDLARCAYVNYDALAAAAARHTDSRAGRALALFSHGQLYYHAAFQLQERVAVAEARVAALSDALAVSQRLRAQFVRHAWRIGRKVISTRLSRSRIAMFCADARSLLQVRLWSLHVRFQQLL
jgi:hypothetical protein